MRLGSLEPHNRCKLSESLLGGEGKMITNSADRSDGTDNTNGVDCT